MMATMRIGRDPARTREDVRNELGARIDQLDRDVRLLSVGELCRRADAIRQLAAADRLTAVAGLAGGFAEALGRNGRSAMVRPYLDGMREALGCEAQDEASAGSYLAAVGVRLAG